MIANDTYTPVTMSRLLLRAGQWDAALALLDGLAGDDAAEARAEILVDRLWWRGDDPAPALAAVAALDPASVSASHLRGQLAFTRLLFGRDALPDDIATAEAGFLAAARDASLRGWGTFRLGVLADNVLEDPVTARARYDEALELSSQDNDLFLESFVVRHIGGHLIESDRAAGEALLRRSLHLRSALGARPQVAAAQATLAGELPDGAEREALRRSARATIDELGLAALAGAADG